MSISLDSSLLEPDRHRDQTLLGTVMEIALDPLALDPAPSAARSRDSSSSRRSSSVCAARRWFSSIGTA
jgi:hypothetical protein